MKFANLEGAKIANTDARHTVIAIPLKSSRFFLSEIQRIPIVTALDNMLARELLKIKSVIPNVNAKLLRPRAARDCEIRIPQSKIPDTIPIASPRELVFPQGSCPSAK